eukprot:3489635-Prymnesium_polylepis.1
MPPLSSPPVLAVLLSLSGVVRCCAAAPSEGGGFSARETSSPRAPLSTGKTASACRTSSAVARTALYGDVTTSSSAAVCARRG